MGARCAAFACLALGLELDEAAQRGRAVGMVSDFAAAAVAATAIATIAIALVGASRATAT